MSRRKIFCAVAAVDAHAQSSTSMQSGSTNIITKNKEQSINQSIKEQIKQTN
jgi:hypothetical protein